MPKSTLGAKQRLRDFPVVKVRRVIFNLHLYTGLVVGLLLVLSGLTGSLLVFREEIEEQVYPELMPQLIKAAPPGKRVSIQVVRDAVGRAYPHERPSSISLPHTPQQAYKVSMNDAHHLLVYVDPYSGKILGAHRQADTFMGWIGLLHTELLSGERGEIILGIGAVLLICMGVTGIILWWPRNGKITSGFKVQWAAPWKKMNFDLHRASGIYAAPFVLITAFTGVSLVFNETVAGIINAVTLSPAQVAPPLSGPRRAEIPMPDLDRLLQQAEQILPAATATRITFPQTPQAPWVIRKKFPQESQPNGRNFIYFDQYTGKVLQVVNTTTAPLGIRIYNVLYPTHIGVIGGTSTRILQVIIGLVPTVLFITGFIMWKNRKQKNMPGLKVLSSGQATLRE